MHHVERLPIEHGAARAVDLREGRVAVRLPVVVLIHEPHDAADVLDA
jgi:hypothetical protein